MLGGLLLATSVACTDQASPRAVSTTPVAEVTAAPIEEPLTYTVVSGDFLSEIARRFEVELDELIEINNIENAALIEVGQELVIPGASTTVVDLFALTPAERWPEIYPPQELPPPPEPTPLEELRNRIAALPWPPRDTMVSGGVIAGFAITALVAGLALTSVEYHTRRWARRTTPRAARRAFRWWGNAAVVPRHTYLSIRRRALAGWRLTVIAVNATWAGIKAADRRYRRARTAVIMGWVRTKVHRERIAERAKPVIERADDIAGRAVDVTLERTRELVDTVRDRAPAATDSFNVIGERATSVRRTVTTGAQRARRDVFEAAPPPERWRTRIAGELAKAFERGQLQVRYVPVIDLDAHALSAVEAHLFWQHPQRGLMVARDIHTATQDHPELGAALLEFLLEQSCGFVKDRIDRRFPSAQLIVPVTLEQIVESEPLAAIDRGLTSANLALDRLKVEVAEPHALQDPLTAAAFIRNLRSMGIGVHLDDYGMAASQDLAQLGVSSVTVDFAAAGTSSEARNILSDAVEAAQDLRLPVTARHSRTEAARALQVSLGCSFEAVGEPLPADAFVKAHVEEAPAKTESEPTPLSASTTSIADVPEEPVSTNASPPASAEPDHHPNDAPVDDTRDRQTHRPAGPLRVSRPSLARPTAAPQSSEGVPSVVSPASSEPSSDEALGADEAQSEDAEDATEAATLTEGDNAASGRPVDAA